MLQSAKSSTARVKKELFSPSMPLHNSRGAWLRGCLKCWVWGCSRRQDIGRAVVYCWPVWKILFFSYVSEVGTVYLVLESQPCPSIPEQPAKSIKRGAAASELHCKGRQWFWSLCAEKGQRILSMMTLPRWCETSLMFVSTLDEKNKRLWRRQLFNIWMYKYQWQGLK